jgi:transcriptional regulator with XRE-family HTH domain
MTPRFNRPVPVTAASVKLETGRRMRRIRIHVGDDVRRLRLDAGVTLSELAAVTGIDRSHLRRIESGDAMASVDALAAVGVALGADLGVRYFPGAGPRLVDRFQAPMIEGFLPELDDRWSVRLEVPVTTPHRGVIDAALTEREARLVVAGEFQSEFRRLEQEIRWSNEKADGLGARSAEEDPDVRWSISRLLVVRSTTTTRDVARRYEATLRAAYPARTRDVLEALTTSAASWPGAGIVWMRVERGRGALLDGPPRGVRLGR